MENENFSTPRTDALVATLNPAGVPGNTALIPTTFARTLERELAAAEWLLSKVNTKAWADLKASNAALSAALARSEEERKEANERASVIDGYLVDIRDKAALIANNAPEEKERFIGRQIILMSSSALGEGCEIKSGARATIADLTARLATSEAARRDEESWWKEKHDYQARAEKAEKALGEAERRVENQKSFFDGYAKSLDGLLTNTEQCSIPGAGMDGLRDKRNIRAIADALKARAESAESQLKEAEEAFTNAAQRASTAEVGLFRTQQQLAAALERVAVTEHTSDLYSELIYAVATKYDGESRHDTALRYIRQAENKESGPDQELRAAARPDAGTL